MCLGCKYIVTTHTYRFQGTQMVVAQVLREWVDVKKSTRFQIKLHMNKQGVCRASGLVFSSITTTQHIDISNNMCAESNFSHYLLQCCLCFLFLFSLHKKNLWYGFSCTEWVTRCWTDAVELQFPEVPDNVVNTGEFQLSSGICRSKFGNQCSTGKCFLVALPWACISVWTDLRKLLH